jgi:transcription antitermination factor NusG
MEYKWYVAQAPFMTERIKEKVRELSFETFVPTLKTTYEGKVNGKSVVRTANKLLTFNYVFVRGEQRAIEEELKGITRLHLIYKRPGVSKGKSYGNFIRTPMVITDREMDMFIKTVSLYQNGAPIVDISERELQKGDVVRVTGGPFAGVEGVLVTQKGKEGGKVVVNISHLVSVTTVDIEPQYIQVVKFSNENKHIYRKMDAFLPKVKAMIGKRSGEICLAEEERVELQKFLNSYAEAETGTLNSAAKLKTLVFMAYIALGMDDYAARCYRLLREEILPKIKGERVKVLIEEQLQMYQELLG